MGIPYGNSSGGIMKQDRNKVIARLGIIAALIIVALALDTVISSPFPIKIAAVSIIVVAVICELFGIYYGLFGCTVFGLISLIRAFTIPAFTSPSFQNPLISILPRILIAFFVCGVYALFSKIFRNKGNFLKETLPSSLGGIFCAASNTVLVISAMSIFSDNGGDVLTKVVQTFIGINGITEILCGAFIVPALVVPLKKIFIKKGFIRTEEKSEKVGE